MKRDSVDIFSDGEIASSMQKSSNDCGNDVTKTEVLKIMVIKLQQISKENCLNEI